MCYEASAVAASKNGIDDNQLYSMLKQSIEYYRDKSRPLKKVLLLPPDLTRMHSKAGVITAMYYSILKESCEIDIMPALGTHEPMTKEECTAFFGPSVPYDRIVHHNWRNDVVKIGEVPADFVSRISGGLIDYSIDVEINKRILDRSYDLIISIGQVVPHEVVGMANYTKNILVGCGGSKIINKSHMLGAVFGMERIMGRDHSPVRQVFDYAESSFLSQIPLMYVLTVTTSEREKVTLEGLFIGRSRRLFEEAVKLSQEKNLIFLEKPLKKTVVYLDEREFKSTWLGNKSIYRTRMAIQDGGELIVLAPGVRKFGEDDEIDKLIRKYGYAGRDKILKLYKENDDLQNNLSAAAHLIHGSSDNRFRITYAVEKLSREEVGSVHYNYVSFKEACTLYDPNKLKDGFNIVNGEKIYYISNPALGLWAYKKRFYS